ncbi:HsdM family class I SAM-dependent methyltransferase [Natranaeroarchaeum sulfidigenes]|uniref:Type I restriction-modification system methyltransferase subunit n=1 Tax=Natranaeroarchaeum sulfidigenes TaxID=2784880 RepID=A0A897MR95_9EURY|nr:N-6 DNA methylase [Natranaeroarchaeum sulfidigenes]QSG02841.1 Type I restriction-modification system methyltransferase subunit [Natranaeroarchaeum sulfidigenes]
MSREVSEQSNCWNLSVSTGETYGAPTPDSITDLCQYVAPPEGIIEHETTELHGDNAEENFDEELLEVITTTAHTIVSRLDGNIASDCQDELAAWCDSHGLNSIDQCERRTIIARQAVFSLWLKASLYEWYHDRGELPSLGSDLQEAFQQAKDKTECPGFDQNVLDEVVHLADEAHKQAVVAQRHRLVNSTKPAVVIGRLYEALLSNDGRDTLGQYRTPQSIGRVMRRWATTSGDTVLDPGMGSAALSSPGFPGWMLHSDPDHVHGIDRSPLSRLMGTVTLTLVGQEHTTQTTDYLSIAPQQVSETVDAIVCNPPYVRYNELSTEYRATLNEQAERLAGFEIPGKTPLHGYFIYHAGACLSPGDRMAIIVPHHVLHRQYGEAIKRYLLDRFRIHGLALYDPKKESVFDTADTTALLLFLEASSQTEPAGTTRLISIEDVENTGWHRELQTDTPGTRDWGHVIHVEQPELQPEEDWSQQLKTLTVDTTNLTPLSEIADVTRGISTGDNGFFCLSQAEVEEYGIDNQHLQPLIRKVSTVTGYEYRSNDWRAHREANREAWLLYLDDLDEVPAELVEAKETRGTWGVANLSRDEPVQRSAGVYDYLHEAVPDITSTKLQNRAPWYRVDRRDSPQIVMPTLSRDGFDTILNHSSALILNNGNGIYPDPSLTQNEIKALAAFLNSTVGEELLRYHAETRPSGAYRITSGSLGDVQVIDPRILDPDVIADLAALFDELSEPGSDDGNTVDRIDAALADSIL